MTILKEIQTSLQEVRWARHNLLARDAYALTFSFDNKERELLEQYERCITATPLSPGDIIILSDVMKQYETRVARIANILEQKHINKPNNDVNDAIKALEIRQKGLMWLVLITHFTICVVITFMSLGYL